MELRRILFIILLFTCFSVVFSAKKNILVLNSYHADFKWTENEIDGIVSVFDEKKHDVEFLYQFMDTKRFIQDDYFDILEKYYSQKYFDYIPDAVVATDDNAFRFVMEGRLHFEKNIPVIFVGLNEYEMLKNLEYINVTGVKEDIDLKSSIEFVYDLIDNPGEFVFISDNKSRTGIEYISNIESGMAEYESQEYRIIKDLPEKELLKNISLMDKDDILFFLSYVKDGDGKNIDFYNLVNRLPEFFSGAVFVFQDILVGDGVLGGKVISPYDMGVQAGKILHRVLYGEEGFIPEIETSMGKYILDYKVMDKLSIEIERIPDGVLVLNAPQSIFEGFGIYIYTIILVLSILSVILLVSLFQLKEKKKYSMIITSQNESIEKSIKELKKRVKKSDELNCEYEELNYKLNSTISLMSYMDTEMKLKEFFRSVTESILHLIDESEYACVFGVENGNCYFIDSNRVFMEKDLEFSPGYKNRIWELDARTFIEDKTIGEIIPEEIVSKIKMDCLNENRIMAECINTNSSKSIFVVFNTLGECVEFTEASKNAFNSVVSIIKGYLNGREEVAEIRKAFLKFASKLSLIAEYKINIEGHFSERVSALSSFIAESIGLENSTVEDIRRYSPLYDIGKVFVPPRILNKKEALSNSEWEIIKKHTLNSTKLLKGEYFEFARIMAIYHHEKYDGTGYPLGISGKDIPISAQIVGLVDSYITLRVIKMKSHHTALEELVAEGRQGKYNPLLINVLLERDREIENIFNKV